MAAPDEVTRELVTDRSQGWLAVDRRGHVAWFHERFGGARPLGAVLGTELSISRLDQARLPPCGFLIDAAGFAIERGGHKGGRVASLVLLEETLASGLGLAPTRTTEGCSVALLRPGRLGALHEQGLCLGCAPCASTFFERVRAREQFFVEGVPRSGGGDRYLRTASALGVGYPSYGCFGYVHTEASSEVALPYARRYVPERALNVEQLPAELAERVQCCELPLEFAAASTIQPAEHAYCALNGRRYLTSQQRVVRGT